MHRSSSASENHPLSPECRSPEFLGLHAVRSFSREFCVLRFMPPPSGQKKVLSDFVAIPVLDTTTTSDSGTRVSGARSGEAFQGAMNASEKRGVELFAKLTGNVGGTRKGHCKKCGQDGHLAFQCRNFLRTRTEDLDEISSTSSESEGQGVAPTLQRMAELARLDASSDSSDSSDSESSSSEERRRRKKLKKKERKRKKRAKKARKRDKKKKEKKKKKKKKSKRESRKRSRGTHSESMGGDAKEQGDVESSPSRLTKKKQRTDSDVDRRADDTDRRAEQKNALARSSSTLTAQP